MALGDDPPGRVEAKAGAAADLLGREEGIEDPLADRLGDPGPVVGDVDLDAVTVPCGLRS